jgi:hypothetical protein
MEKLSAHISWKEATHSNTAIRKGIDNTPSPDQVGNMIELAQNIFEPLREWVGQPIRINSFFRSAELNAALGSASTTSQHLCNNGAAIDLDDDYCDKTNAEMFHYIKDNLDFDQLIWEFGTINNPDWVHVSYKAEGNRKQILKAVRVDGSVKYLPYE